ncbi:hypothetical protein [Sphingomonas sp.]|uniref:hypothetical protein n=1 Tax=Sphingomonas sp. TaxID=28214 RepID=UPI003AFFDC18
MRPFILVLLLMVLSGCVARTAFNVATLPVRAGSQMVDWTTTSRDEADRNYGRKMRKQKKREAKQHAREDEANRKWEREEAKRQREAIGR